MATCPNCGQQNPDNFLMCGMCGADLTGSTPAAPDVRKTVTLVFSDVVGSTSLGEGRDPEAIRGIMNRHFAEMRRIIERHGGLVEKFIGDAVMAAFGIPLSHEDDALRAVRAASEMRATLEILNGEFEREWGARIEVRTGVNTGEVVAGDVFDRQTFATGDTVNTAARLEQAAQPGEILMGEGTYRLVKDLTRAEAVAPLSLKGKAKPYHAYRLLEVLDRPEQPARLPGSPMLGRDPQMKLLADIAEQARVESRCQLVTVMGEPGVGKTRLLEEYAASLDGRATVLRGRCVSYGEGITLRPVVEIVRQAASIEATDLPVQAREKIERLVAGRESAPIIAERLAALTGSSDGSDVPLEETFWAVRIALESLADTRPLVVVIEDIHWVITLIDLIASGEVGQEGAPLSVRAPELLDEQIG